MNQPGVVNVGNPWLVKATLKLNSRDGGILLCRNCLLYTSDAADDLTRVLWLVPLRLHTPRKQVIIRLLADRRLRLVQ